MVILDSDRNGYRNIILPFAAQDQLTRRAVASVAACHLYRGDAVRRPAALIERAKVVQDLTRISLSPESSSVFTTSIWATLLVLLVGELALGGDHYPYFVRMLASLRDGLTKLDSDVLRFLRSQTEL